MYIIFQNYFHIYNLILKNKLSCIALYENLNTVLLQRDSQRNKHIYNFILYANNVMNTYVNDKDTTIWKNFASDNFYIKYNFIIYDYKNNGKEKNRKKKQNVL